MIAILLALCSFGAQSPEERLEVGRMRDGVILAADPALDSPGLRARGTRGPARARSFVLDVDESGPYTIELRSHFFDAYLVLRDAAGAVLAENDNDAGRSHARIVATLEAGASYRVDACALPDLTGEFTVSATRGEPEALTPAEVLEHSLADARARLAAWEAKGEKGPTFPNVIKGLAFQLYSSGGYREATEHFRRALAMQIELFGPESVPVADTTSSLAACLQGRGQYDEAERCFRRSIAIRERSAQDPAQRDLRLSQSLNSLALLLFQRGDYRSARPLFERVIALQRSLGVKPRMLAVTRTNFALLLASERNFEGAERELEAALESFRSSDPPVPRDMAFALDQLSLLREEQGRRPEARQFVEQALALREEQLGPEHPDVARSALRLAQLLRRDGEYEEARKLLERAIEIRRKSTPENPLAASALCELAGLLHDHGRFDEARPMYVAAQRAWIERLGREHPWTAASQRILACLELDAGNGARAWELALDSLSSSEGWLRRQLCSMTERERLAFVAAQKQSLELLLSLPRPEGTPDPERSTYEAVLRWKGQVSRSLQASKARLLEEMTPAQQGLLEQLARAQADLSNALFQSEAADPEAHSRELVSLRERRDALELEMHRSLGELDAEPAPDVDALRAALPADSVAVDFLLHRDYVPGSRGEDGDFTQGSWGETRLTAWVVAPEQRTVARVELGPAAPIERATTAFLDVLRASRGEGVTGEGDPLAARNSELRRLVWDPLAKHVGAAKLVFVSPDRFLGSLAFETLALDGGAFLVELHAFVYPQDMLDVVRIVPTERVRANNLLVVGRVDYRARTRTAKVDIQDAATTPVAVAQIDDGAGRGGFQSHWEPLSFTGKEMSTVLDLHETYAGEAGTRLALQGSDATEEALKRELPRHAYCHVATHGFFQPEGFAAHALGADAGSPRAGGEEANLLAALPGLLSGIVCAGANVAPCADEEDGILTAEEVGWLDLSRCELVVLSACETALGAAPRDAMGQLLNGEGLLGLRRSFREAGAATVISSLWRIDDEETASWMRAFYQRLWQQGSSKIDALHGAQLERLREDRARTNGRARPWVWGAFVLDGDWR